MNQRQRKRAAEGVPRGGVELTDEERRQSAELLARLSGPPEGPRPAPPRSTLDEFRELRDNLDELGHELMKSAPGRAVVRLVVWLNGVLERRRQRRLERRKGKDNGPSRQHR